MNLGENAKVMREKFWEEMSPDEKLEKIGQAVELLSRWMVDAERDRCLLNQHTHGSDGRILIPMQHNMVEQPWYKSHLLNRAPKGGL